MRERHVHAQTSYECACGDCDGDRTGEAAEFVSGGQVRLQGGEAAVAVIPQRRERRENLPVALSGRHEI